MHKIVLLYLLILGYTGHSQSKTEVLFYNVENLFDNKIDSTRGYKEFNPGEKNNWDQFKYWKKINSLAKVIASCSDSVPDFLGFAEIENQQVVKDIVSHPLLFKHHFEVIHFESDDVRGIDVAFAYKQNKFNLLSFKKIKINKKRRPTRDILMVTGVLLSSNDTLAFFVNHWPSRYGGKKKSEKSRILAATTLLNAMKTHHQSHPNTKLIATGDFNDTPSDSSLSLLTTDTLLNLVKPLMNKKKNNKGTLKYRHSWQVFDQFLVSNNCSSFTISSAIFSPSWLLIKDKKYGGVKPFRTFQGPIYKGGISDHLPILLTLKTNPN